MLSQKRTNLKNLKFAAATSDLTQTVDACMCFSTRAEAQRSTVTVGKNHLKRVLQLANFINIQSTVNSVTRDKRNPKCANISTIGK